MINDITNTWFCADLHFNHYNINKQGEPRGVILFERTQFKTIKQHDDYLVEMFLNWGRCHQGHTLYILGDFGDIEYLFYIIKTLRYTFNINCRFVYGNHDKISDLEKFQDAFNEVYLNPVYIHPRIIISHEPVWPAPVGTLNIHGHLHCSKLDMLQYFNVNIHMLNYQLASSKRVMNLLGKLEKPSFKFLEENYARHIVFTQYKEDAIYDKKTGKIDYEASIQMYNKNHPDHPKYPIPKYTLSW